MSQNLVHQIRLLIHLGVADRLTTSTSALLRTNTYSEDTETKRCTSCPTRSYNTDEDIRSRNYILRHNEININDYEIKKG